MANKLMSKSELIQKIADKHGDGITRKDVKGVVEALAEIGYKELKKTGAFVVPGFAKFVVIVPSIASHHLFLTLVGAGNPRAEKDHGGG